jgi:hypothetical protein
MKVTIITDHFGNLVATVKGHSLSSKHGDLEAGIAMGAGQKAHYVEVDDALGKITDGAEFHEKIKKYIPKS